MFSLSTILLTLATAIVVQGYFTFNTQKPLTGSEKFLGNNEFLSRQNYVAETVHNVGVGKVCPKAERDATFWRNSAYREVHKSLKKQHLNLNKAKNIIMFLGDGMSVSTITAARILKGQNKGHTGEEEKLYFENFPYSGLSKTYCTNAQVPDSACTATAYLCGVKTNIATIGVNAHVDFNNCTASMDPMNHVSSIAQWAQKAGKSTGFITTTSLTHASPSGLYAHVSNRLHESDRDIKNTKVNPADCMDIATQLITQEPGRNFNVIMGGGMAKFLPNTKLDAHGNFGIREDGKNLLDTWRRMHTQGKIVTNRSELLSVDTSKVSHIMGIFHSNLMDYHAKANPLKQPTLAEMTKVALKLLQPNDKGYFIFIEGGLIDVAHHDTKAAISLEETLEFEKAIQLAREITNPAETLIVVTSDHAHGLTISGYPERGNDILGLNQHDTDVNGFKYSTLNYPIGIKQYLDDNGKRLNLEDVKRDKDFQYPSYIKATNAAHSGEDVAIFASGPYEHLFTGTIEQNTLPYLMAYPACIGQGPTLCDY